MPRPFRLRSLVLGLVLMAAAATSASAGIVTAGAAMTVQAAPGGTLTLDSLQSNSSFLVWFESQVTLGSALSVDHVGAVNFPSGFTAGTIASGTQVDSYYIHADPTANNNNQAAGGGQQALTFDGQILGVILLTGSFGTSDTIFAPAGLTYNDTGLNGVQAGDGRGYEWNGKNNGDGITISADLLTLTIGRSDTGIGNVDGLRVLVAPAAVHMPEPGTWALFGVGVLGLGFVVRRRRARCTPAATAQG